MAKASATTTTTMLGTLWLITGAAMGQLLDLGETPEVLHRTVDDIIAARRAANATADAIRSASRDGVRHG